jgi:hypothetical protein
MFFRTPLQTPNKVIFLDVDDVLACPERGIDGKYIADPDGYIHAKLIDLKLFQKFVDRAKQNNVALNLLTGRPDIPLCQKLLTSFIEAVGGYSKTIGGFHPGCIYFTGIMVEADGIKKWKQHKSKADVVADVHLQQYSHLSHEHICMIDDIDDYLVPFRKMGYPTIHVTPEKQNSLCYFAELELFILASRPEEMIGYGLKNFTR